MQSSLALKMTLYIGLFLGLFGALALYLDPSDGKVPASCIISIVPNLITFYFSNKGQQSSYVGQPASIIYKKPRFEIPDSMAFSLLIVVTIIYMNLLLRIFQENVSDIGLSDNKFLELQIAAVGIIALGNMFPISAIWAVRIGYRRAPSHLTSAFFAVAITIGSLSILTFINAAFRGDSTYEQLIQALFYPGGDGKPSRRGLLFAIAMIAGSGLLSILVIGLWLGLWAKFGYWRFCRRYPISNNLSSSP